MSYIPKKSASVFSQKSVSFEAVYVLLVLMVFVNTVARNYLHSKVILFFLLVLGLGTAYLLFPSKRNKGKNGLQSLVLSLKYEIYKRKINNNKV